MALFVRFIIEKLIAANMAVCKHLPTRPCVRGVHSPSWTIQYQHRQNGVSATQRATKRLSVHFGPKMSCLIRRNQPPHVPAVLPTKGALWIIQFRVKKKLFHADVWMYAPRVVPLAESSTSCLGLAARRFV